MEPLLTIEERARSEIYDVVNRIDAELRATIDSQKGGEAMHREVDIVCSALYRHGDES